MLRPRRLRCPSPLRPRLARRLPLVGLLWLGLAGVAAADPPPPAVASGAAAQRQVSAPAPAAQVPAVLTLYLIRHGAYDESDPRDEAVGKGLTDAGREQARRVGERLAGLGIKFDALWTSPLTRARETAEVVARALDGPPPRIAPELAECRPPARGDDPGLAAGAADSCRARFEAAFTRFFNPATGRDRQEIVVGHGNSIRWLWCRALGVDPAAWIAMTIANCSLTVVRVLPDGACKLYAFDDTGHLPLELQSYAGVAPPWRPSAKEKPAR